MLPETSPMQTIHLAFQEICEGKQPWTALGKFMNDWFCDAKDRREELVAEPIPEATTNKDCQRWAVYCVAVVEHLCNKYRISCPEWVHNPKYTLPEPWYRDPELYLRDWLIASTPEAFSKRNLYVDGDIFDSKWELADRYHDKAKQIGRLGKKEKKQYYKTGKMPVHKD